MTPNLACQLADYNRRMNVKLYAAAARLTEAERKQARGAFFGSLHGTLNHLLWADGLWMARFEAQPSPGGLHATEIAPDFGSLHGLRQQMDARIVRFASTLTPTRLDAPFTWTNTQGLARTHPFYLLIAHFFNHQTHHRGQATTLLSQLNIDIGMTDLPFVLGES